MPTYVALLRSVVISGQRVKMAPVRRWAREIGATKVRTVGATGNFIFVSRKSPSRLERELEASCATHYGCATEIIVKTASAWRALVAANPFATEAERTPAHLLLWAMRSPLPDAGLAQLLARVRGEERLFRTRTGDLYMWFGPEKIVSSKLPSGFSLKALGVVGTNRNWNTVCRICAALDAVDPS